MASKKSDVKFKYVNTIPNNVNEGTFYWKYENNKNQLYFSPTSNKEDILRLDNIVSDDGNQPISSNGMGLVGIYSEPETTITDQSGNVSSWSDNEWESYIENLSESEKYGNISNRYFSKGDIIVCGNREFICVESAINFETITIEGTVYYKSHITDDACVDEIGNKIEYTNTNAPKDAKVSSYADISWECFGENLSHELANKIANFNFDIDIEGSETILVANQNGIYKLSANIKPYNPLTFLKDVEMTDSDDNGDYILMTTNQIKDILNDIIPRWKDTID